MGLDGEGHVRGTIGPRGWFCLGLCEGFHINTGTRWRFSTAIIDARFEYDCSSSNAPRDLLKDSVSDVSDVFSKVWKPRYAVARRLLHQCHHYLLLGDNSSSGNAM